MQNAAPEELTGTDCQPMGGNKVHVSAQKELVTGTECRPMGSNVSVAALKEFTGTNR